MCLSSLRSLGAGPRLGNSAVPSSRHLPGEALGTLELGALRAGVLPQGHQTDLTEGRGKRPARWGEPHSRRLVAPLTCPSPGCAHTHTHAREHDRCTGTLLHTTRLPPCSTCPQHTCTCNMHVCTGVPGPHGASESQVGTHPHVLPLMAWAEEEAAR